MLKTLLLISIIMFLSVAVGREMYKTRQLTTTLKELERTKQAITDRRGKEIIHDKLGSFVSSKENIDDVMYDATAINKLYTKGE